MNATRVCTKHGGEPLPAEDFRRIDAYRRHTWCKKCESEAGKERAARYRHPEGRLAYDCAVVAANLDHILSSYPDTFADLGTAVLGAARDMLRKIADSPVGAL